MGLFDSLFGGMEAATKLTPQESFAGILMAASACDGHFADDEIQGLVTTLGRMKLFSRFTDKQYSQTLQRVHSIFRKKGVDTLVDSCVEGLPNELRETAFANACDIVLADGTVESEERQFMDSLYRKLRLDPKMATEIASIIAVKNKG